MPYDVIVIDDEADIRRLMCGILGDEGYETRQAGNSTEALAAIRSRQPSLVVLDIWLQGSELDGLEILKIVKRELPQLPVVMISGHGNIETAVTAIKIGAYDFIEKPFKADRLILVVERALETSRLRREVSELRSKAGAELNLVGGSAAVANLKRLIEKVGPANSRVLISGPAGSGKELAARMIHAHSARNEGPFVVVNAPAITPEGMESELFGVEAGSDRARRVGALEEAHGGTLYFDEVADMPSETQAKILRVLVDQRFRRVGGSAPVHVDVRIISSTSRDLAQAITDGLFREDLFHRLSVVPILVPSLAERREDIPELIQYFVE